ncbi:MAG: MFS transporter [Acidobacteriia bacterium]|nr:MFS transporter [Terriglobia bacterium]
MMQTLVSQSSVAERTRRRVNRRLMPFLFLLFIVAYLDRANVGMAGLGMSRELGFSDAVFGFGSGIFFLGYFLLEIPGTVLVEIWSARKWIARIMLTWGVLASATGWIHSAQQFYWIRFFLGVAEAGFFPGLVVYLSHWYRAEDRGKAVAMFMAAIPSSLILAGPLGGLLLRVHWLGYGGWRWLLMLEGLPAVVLGFVSLFYLTDRPQEAKWLPSDERDWLVAELEKEKAARAGHTSGWKALKNPQVLLLALVLLLGLAPNYGLSLWLPQMVQRLSGFAVWQVGLIAAIPYVCSLPLMLLTGWHSDRTGERKWHTAIPRLLSGAALTVCFFATNHIWVMILMLSLATVGFYCAHPGFWPLPNLFLGKTAAAASIGFINSFGNLGGFLGPYAIGLLRVNTGSFGAALLLLAGFAYASGILVLLVRTARRGSIGNAL